MNDAGVNVVPAPAKGRLPHAGVWARGSVTVDRPSGRTVFKVEFHECSSLEVGEVALSRWSAQAEQLGDVCGADGLGCSSHRVEYFRHGRW